jgi:hypothetical protein
MSVQFSVRNANILPKPLVDVGVDPSLKGFPKGALRALQRPSGLPAFSSRPAKESKAAKFAREFFGVQRKQEVEDSKWADLNAVLGLGSNQAFGPPPPLAKSVRVINLAELAKAQTTVANAHPLHSVPQGVHTTPIVPPPNIPVAPQPVAASPRPSLAPQPPARPTQASIEIQTEQALSPPLHQIVTHNHYQQVLNHHYLTNQFLQHQHTHSHTSNYHQTVQNNSVINQILNQTAHHHVVNNTLNQQNNAVSVDQRHAIQNNLNLTLDAGDVGAYTQTLHKQPGRQRLVTAPESARLALEDRSGPLIEEVADTPGTALVPRSMTVAKIKKRPRSSLRAQEIEKYKAPNVLRQAKGRRQLKELQ